MPGDSTFNMDFFNDTMEHAIPNTKFTDYDQVISVADSEIRRLLGRMRYQDKHQHSADKD